MKILKYLLCGICYLCLCAFSFINNSEQDTPARRSINRPLIIVYIPGTKLFPTSLNKKYLYRIPGLKKITEYDHSYNCRQIAETLCSLYPSDYALENYYYFGWSGKLSFKERKAAAKHLYEELEKLYLAHKNMLGQGPILRIITHSHGGNVLLNLAKTIPEHSRLMIDEAIVLACPVQDKTKHLASCTRFKKIYAFYSANDMFQVIDPQGLYKNSKTRKVFSERLFPESPNLKQARVKLHGGHPMHVDFIFPKFMQHLPAVCQATDELYAQAPESNTGIKQVDIRYRHQPVRILKKVL